MHKKWMRIAEFPRLLSSRVETRESRDSHPFHQKSLVLTMRTPRNHPFQPNMPRNGNMAQKVKCIKNGRELRDSLVSTLLERRRGNPAILILYIKVLVLTVRTSRNLHPAQICQEMGIWHKK